MCAIVTLAIIGIVIKARTKKDASTSQNQTAGMEAQNESYTEEKTMYFGTTTAGTDYEYFSSTATTPLQVEEVYAETGTQVTTQSAILKVTDESYKQAKKELEQNLKEAKRNLAQAKITYKEDVLSLQTEYNTESVVSDTAVFVCKLNHMQHMDQKQPCESIVSDNGNQIIDGCNQRTGSNCRINFCLLYTSDAADD